MTDLLADPQTGAAARDIAIKLFISYSHADKVWLKRLKPLLLGFEYDARMVRLGSSLKYVHAWHDQQLTAGNPWDPEIKTELAEMDIFVPLVSFDFFSSWYIQNVELPAAATRSNAEKLAIVPILLYPLDLRERCPFLHAYPAFPMSDRCWRSYGDYRNAHSLIDNGLWRAIEQVAQQKLSEGS